MWETEFDESMLPTSSGLSILCPEEHLAEELFELFKAKGIAKNWGDDTRWNEKGEETVYCVKGSSVLFGARKDVEIVGPYCDYKRCTFYGFDTADFETATDDELLTLLGTGGS